MTATFKFQRKLDHILLTTRYVLKNNARTETIAGEEKQSGSFVIDKIDILSWLSNQSSTKLVSQVAVKSICSSFAILPSSRKVHLFPVGHGGIH